MALSNKFGHLVLSTGNKSELSVGYCTLYGDMCGGLAVIADVPKTMVYRLARWINREREIIPWPTIEKPPSAELKPDQRDQDTLPPYEILDPILQLYVEEQLSTRGDRRARLRRADGALGGAARGSERIQARPGGPGVEGDEPRLRARPADAGGAAIRRSRRRAVRARLRGRAGGV